MSKGKVNIKYIFCNLDFIIASFMLMVMIVLTFLGVLWRYILNSPFSWLEEVQLSCMVWIVFLGGGGAFRTGNHTAIEMVVDLLPEKIQKIVDVFISVVLVVVIGYLFIESFSFVQIFIKSGRTTNMLHIPYWAIYGISIPAYIDMIISYIYSKVFGVLSEQKAAIAENSDKEVATNE